MKIVFIRGYRVSDEVESKKNPVVKHYRVLLRLESSPRPLHRLPAPIIAHRWLGHYHKSHKAMNTRYCEDIPSPSQRRRNCLTCPHRQVPPAIEVQCDSSACPIADGQTIDECVTGHD